MKRSAINRYIAEATEFFAANRFVLPPFAHWSPMMWHWHGDASRALRIERLGWDVTDFGHGHFQELGLTLFTLRNAVAHQASKTYAEKIMFVRENQITPYHFHLSKVEDIINRGDQGTGRLLIQLYDSQNDGSFKEGDIHVMCDGIERHFESGEEIVLGPGESITVPPRLYHSFRAIDGHALIGEISSRNDDDRDNHFQQPLPRYPEIEEDEPPLRVLCSDDWPLHHA